MCDLESRISALHVRLHSGQGRRASRKANKLSLLFIFDMCSQPITVATIKPITKDGVLTRLMELLLQVSSSSSPVQSTLPGYAIMTRSLPKLAARLREEADSTHSRVQSVEDACVGGRLISFQSSTVTGKARTHAHGHVASTFLANQ